MVLIKWQHRRWARLSGEFAYSHMRPSDIQNQLDHLNNRYPTIKHWVG